MRRRRRFRLLLSVLAASVAAPSSALTRNDLTQVALAPAPGAKLSLDIDFVDASTGRGLSLGDALAGRPALLLPVDYACRNVCDPMLSLAGAALAATSLRAGADYRLVTLGLDPRESAGTARAMVEAQLTETGLRDATAILTGGGDGVATVTAAIGYRFVYDAATRSYAHPAGAVILTADGRVARALSPLAMTARDLRLALVEAGEGRVGGLADRLLLLCYGFDAKQGVYTPFIRRILTGAGAATVAGIGLLVLLLHRRSRAAG